jgi:hypothetical protein
MDTRDIYKLVRELSEERDDVINLYDSMDIELNEGFVIETGVVGFTEDGVIVHLDEHAMEFLDFNGVLLESENVNESYANSSSADAIYNAVLNRITRQHMDIVGKFGPEAVMYAIEDVAHGAGDVDEIGSSDVSIWTKQVIQDLESGQYSHLKETYTSDESPVYNAVLNRIMRQHLDLLSKYGPAAVMAAVEDVVHSVPSDLDEIGSSDVSIWTRQAIENLEAGHYKRLHEGDYTSVDAFKNKLSKSNDPFEMIYNAISGDYGEEIRHTFQEMYDDVVIDSHGRLHPDDDFEPIINTIVDQLVDDSSGYDELDEIKRLALGHKDEQLEEGWKKTLAAAALGITALVGANKLGRDYTIKNDPQLQALQQMLDDAKAQGAPKSEVQELQDRLDQTYNHNTITGHPVLDPNGKAADPRHPFAGESMHEAEYQGRKVPLGKPMQGDVKKSKVYVRKPNGKVVKVNFGDKNMRIKKNSPSHRKSFRARHHCENPGPRWKARYWSCRAW